MAVSLRPPGPLPTGDSGLFFPAVNLAGTVAASHPSTGTLLGLGVCAQLCMSPQEPRPWVPPALGLLQSLLSDFLVGVIVLAAQ